MTYHLTPTGNYQPLIPVVHRDDEYDQTGFDTLWDMQERHFWYRGRHRFLLKALDRFMPKTHSPLRAIDLGGGVGGWVCSLPRQLDTPMGDISVGLGCCQF